MAVPTFTSVGAKASVAATLPKEVFGIEVTNHELVKQAYLGYLAAGRTNNAHVKKRGEVRGGGRKPWRQKGTGRARFGSTRNPIWRAGGVAFGPTGEENYTRNLSVASRRQALRQALSMKNAAGSVAVIEKLGLKNNKTKEAAMLLSKIDAKGSVLVIVPAVDVDFGKAVKNLPNVSTATAKGVSTYHVMNADTVLVAKDAVAVLAERLGVKGGKK